MSDEKIISFRGGPVHFNHMAPGQLFTPGDVIGGLPMDEVDELVVIARTRAGQLYVGATHSTASVSLLLGNAAHFIHRAYSAYGADE